MAKPKLLRRFRWKRYGGLVEVRVYEDGSSRVRVDHPSNHPEVELLMAGSVLTLMRAKYAELGMGLNIGPIRWRDDPPTPSTRSG